MGAAKTKTMYTGDTGDTGDGGYSGDTQLATGYDDSQYYEEYDESYMEADYSQTGADKGNNFTKFMKLLVFETVNFNFDFKPYIYSNTSNIFLNGSFD